MAHHPFGGGKHRRPSQPYRDPRPREDGPPYGVPARRAAARGPRIPGAVVLGGIALWSLLALGLWALVDPLLAWAAGMAGPATDLGVGVARWFGVGNEVSALRDAANVGGLVGWAVGPIHFLAKVALVLVWLAGAAALIALPMLLRRRPWG